MRIDCTILSDEYPEYVSAEQLCRICHISKRKAKWLLDNQIIPCQDNGKKTHRYTIRLDDISKYLYILEKEPDKVSPPVGLFTAKHSTSPISLIDSKGFMWFLHNTWENEPEALTPKDIHCLIGYRTETINEWIYRRKLTSVKLPDGTSIVAKKWLIKFIASYTIKNPRHLSKANRDLATTYMSQN